MAFLTSRLGLSIIGGLLVVIALGIYIAGLKGEIRSGERRVAAVELALRNTIRDLTQCRANTATLEASISRQNAAVEAMRVQGEARVAELDRVASRARQEAESAARRANRILGRQSTGNACEDARALILETVD